MASPLAALATLLAFVAAVSAVQVRSHTEVEANKLDIVIADNAPLTEKGYQQVAEQKSDAEMKVFIHRLLAKEARYVKDAGDLEGMVRFYSGTEGVQNLEKMKAELRNAPWVAIGEGRTAPLNDFGYQKVARLKSNAHMTAFIRRLLDAKGKKCLDEGALTGIVPYYSGELATQTFDHLSQEVLSATWAATRGQEEPIETTIATTEEEPVELLEAVAHTEIDGSPGKNATQSKHNAETDDSSVKNTTKSKQNAEIDDSPAKNTTKSKQNAEIDDIPVKNATKQNAETDGSPAKNTTKSKQNADIEDSPAKNATKSKEQGGIAGFFSHLMR